MNRLLITSLVVYTALADTITTLAQAAQTSQSYIPNIPTTIPSQQPTSSPIISSAATSSISILSQTNCSIQQNTYWSGYRCACKPGFIQQNGICFAINLQTSNPNIFRPAQFIDKISLLYSPNSKCSDNEIINSKNQCQCRQNYVRYNGNTCLSCPLSSQYNQLTKQCTCQLGKSFINGNCQDLCTNTNQIYDERTSSCVCKTGYQKINGICQIINVCPTGATVSGNTCICQTGFYYSNNACLARCGDGIVISTQRCDDGNTLNSDGCSSNCQIQSGFTCSGTRPSVCTRTPVCGDRIISGTQQCDDGNTVSGDGCFNCLIQSGWNCTSQGCSQIVAKNNLTQIGDITFNFNNVYVVLQTAKSYSTLTDFQKSNFIRYSFPDSTTQPTSVYCVQNKNNFARFECLLVYASGLPNKLYTVNFSYSFNGDTGSLAVPIDPLKSTFRTRSLS